MKDYTKALEGMTYLEWQKLKHEVDLRFEIKKSELLNKAKLTLDFATPSSIARAIRDTDASIRGQE